MLKVTGNIYPNKKKYHITLEVDSIYQGDLPIERSSELIKSAIHLQLKIPYNEIQRFDVSGIYPIINQNSVNTIISKVNDPLFEKHFRNGLNLVGTQNWEDAGNRLGVAFEILIKKILSPSIKISGNETLGNLIALMIKNNIFTKQEETLLWQANSSRRASSHDSSIFTNRTDYLKLFDAINLVVHKFF
ncbi:hypothetical protein [Enterococcus dongliensis]|uniref:hypothetical protein n=1 Tax=Enterococcus dongliensis TaxID=2559925 RepID=UPI0028920570|nr:hypothetical protein [Enterococcus dongliensis]MDT2613130.1 hypothetical protein [Enterococcus dongliensis]